MADVKAKNRNLDIWLIMVIVLLVLSIGGGLWLTGRSMLTRLDVLGFQVRSQLGTLESEVFELRKQVQTLSFAVRKTPGMQPPAPQHAGPDVAAAPKSP